MNLPFSADQFFDVFGAYNQALWPALLGLWAYAAIGVVALARDRPNHGRWIAVMLAVQWAWAGLVYHAAFFSSINPAAWLFGGLFVAESVLFVWFGVLHDRLRFSPRGSPRHILAWVLIAYALSYPLLARAGGHTFPRMPTYGVPCPTTLLTIGFLFTVDPPLPRLMTVVPIIWAFVGGSAAVFLSVRADLMLWAAGLALAGYVLTVKRSRVLA
jgi:hypothetical protein